MADPSVWQPAITAAATITGTIVGAVGGYLLQRAQWNRQFEARWDESKKMAYASLLTACNQWDRAVRGKDREAAETYQNEVMGLLGEVSLLASEQTRSAAASLLNYLFDFEGRYLDRSGRIPPEEAESYDLLRQEFRASARAELMQGSVHH